LKQLNPGKLKFVLNTHHHGDHTGGNAYFGRDASIVAHANARKRLGGDGSLAANLLPIVTFDQSLSIHFNGEEIKMIHVPAAHTDNDSIIHFTGANVIHFGDTFFAGRFPNIDLRCVQCARLHRERGGASSRFPDAQLIQVTDPWHRQGVKEFHAMLIEQRNVQRIDAGKRSSKSRQGPPEMESWSVPSPRRAGWKSSIPLKPR
jgi:hypothetical protein